MLRQRIETKPVGRFAELGDSDMHAKAALLSFALMMGAGSAAQATTTVYTDEAAYRAAISAAGADTFDDLAVARLANALTRSAGDYSYSVSADHGLYGAGENGDGWITTNYQSDALTFSNFTGGVSAIGGYFFGSDINGAYADLVQIALTFTDGEGVQTIELPNWPTASTFVGFVSSDGIQSLSVQMNGFPLPDWMTPEEAANYFQWPTANNIILGQSPQDPPPPVEGSVPEPASWALMLGGFGLVGAALRGRRRSVVSFG
jgi:hypothetical protein